MISYDRIVKWLDESPFNLHEIPGFQGVQKSNSQYLTYSFMMAVPKANRTTIKPFAEIGLYIPSIDPADNEVILTVYARDTWEVAYTIRLRLDIPMSVLTLMLIAAVNEAIRLHNEGVA